MHATHAVQHHSFPEGIFSKFNVGEVAEWFKAHAWRACGDRKVAPEFDSLPLRNFFQIREKITDAVTSVKRLDKSRSEYGAVWLSQILGKNNGVL